MECKYNQDEICVNAKCPMRADYCPVSDTIGVCKYEEREEERWTLSPKGCLMAALLDYDIRLDDEIFDDVWDTFSRLMTKLGYVHEDGD